MKSIKGFSLVELMITIGLISGIGLLVMNITKESRKSSTKFELDTDIVSTTSEINAILSDPATCLATFTSATPTNIGEKYYISTDPLAPSGGYGIGGFKINEFRLSGTAPDGVLTISYQNKNFLIGNTGVVDIKKTIKIYMVDNPGPGPSPITTCRSLSSTSTGIWSYGSANSLFFNGGNMGIGTSDPKVKLEVGGEVKVSNTGLTCNSDSEGSIRYNSTTTTPPTPKRMEFCNGTQWSPF